MNSPVEGLRADAQLNRRRILDVARPALTADPEVSLNAIAKLAGVGPGTLYRHFPNRAALVLEIYRQDIQAMVDLAASLLAEHPPLAALRLWLDHLAHYGRIKQSVSDALHAVLAETDQAEVQGPMYVAATRLLQAGREAGVIRPGVDAEDLFLLTGFVFRMPPGPEGDARTVRLLDLVIDGLKPPA